MKHKYLFILLVMLCNFLNLWSLPVGRERAEMVARNFLNQMGNLGISNYQLTDKTSEMMINDMYLFVNNDGGFVLIAADDRVLPILAYDLHNQFPKDIPAHVRDWLAGYSEEIQYLRENQIEATEYTRSVWRMVESVDSIPTLYNSVIAPLCSTTWGQSPRYNNMCPYSSSANAYAVAGCVATATAQVMKYWNHPQQGTGSHSYTHSTFGTLSASFGTTTYDWLNMPNALTANSTTTEINAVATLIYHVGVSVNMNYGTGGSGATTTAYGSLTTRSAENSLRTYFKYKSTIHSMYKSAMNDSTWCALLDAELEARRPVIYSGRDTSGGHAFVCDGRNASDQFHINWGWRGSYDGYYTMGALNPGSGGTGGNATYTFNLSQAAIVGIEPAPTLATNTTYQVSALADRVVHGTVSGGGNYHIGDTISLVARANNGFRFAYWSDGMVYNPRKTIVAGNDSYTAIYQPITGDTLYYCSNIHQTSYGSPSNGQYHWGIMLDTIVLSNHNRLESVQLYCRAGTFTLKLYSCNNPSNANPFYTETFTATNNSLAWNTFTLNTPQIIDTATPLFILFSNTDVGYPGTVSTYSGSENSKWRSSNGTSWSTLGADYSFMIRAILYQSLVVPTYHVSVTSAQAERGFVTGSGQYSTGYHALLQAVANPCYHFERWSDGSTSNPRLITVTSDTNLIAYFKPTTYAGDTVALACDSFVWHGNEYHSSTDTATWKSLTSRGCDSTTTLHLTINHSKDSYTTEKQCDSLTWIDGITYRESTRDISFHLTTTEGCDSTIHLNLSISRSSNDTLHIDTIGSFLWNGTVYSESGSYTYNYTSSDGCDSTVTLVLNLRTIGIDNLYYNQQTPIYPNPTNRYIYIDREDIISVEIYDLNGRCWGKFLPPLNRIDLEILPDGIYYVRVRTHHNNYDQTIVKQQ